MTELLPFFLFAISTTFTPGPNNFLILNSGLNFGIKRSVPHFLGICIGFPLMMIVVALGFGAILTQYDWMHHFFKLAGSAYMLYLAWQILRSNTKTQLSQPLKPMTFLQAALFQWVNPKAWMIAVSAISIFTLTNHYLSNAIAISVLLGLTCLFTIGAWLVFGSFLKKILKNEKHIRWFNITMAVSLVASIALIFLEY